jgi:hypothetical protein
MKNEIESDPSQTLMLDANAAAGILQRLFGTDVTASPVQCDGCRREGMLGEARAYMHAPGVVLRCKRCDSVMLRVVETPDALYLEARGLTYLCLPFRQT